MSQSHLSVQIKKQKLSEIEEAEDVVMAVATSWQLYGVYVTGVAGGGGGHKRGMASPVDRRVNDDTIITYSY